MNKLIYIVIIGLYSVTAVLPQERSFEWYGYAQFDFIASDQKGSISSFDQRRLNLIGEFNNGEKIRIISDIEYEGGADISGTGNNVGTIKISRTWMEYTVTPQLKFKTGKMLTPFGLYNLIHDASASYFAVDPPLMYSALNIFPGVGEQRLYSKYYIGIEATGVFDLNDEGSQLEYFVGIGNGRGSTGSGLDINNNKALLGRIIYRPSIIYGLQVGGSFYTDRNYEGIGGIKNDNESAYAIDLQYEDSYIQWQTEAIMANYTNPENTRQNTALVYTQVAYTLLGRYTPFVNFTETIFDMNNTKSGFRRLNFGVNVNVSSGLFVKGELQFHSKAEERDFEDGFHFLKLSAVVAF